MRAICYTTSESKHPPQPRAERVARGDDQITLEVHRLASPVPISPAAAVHAALPGKSVRIGNALVKHARHGVAPFRPAQVFPASEVGISDLAHALALAAAGRL